MPPSLKQFTAAIFLIAFTAVTFSKVVIFISFFANQKYIAENLCINKAKPATNCCGKCQLSKKITNEDNKDRQNPTRKNENKNEVFSPTSFNTSESRYWQPIVKRYPPFRLNKCTDRSFAIFHPPLVLPATVA